MRYLLRNIYHNRGLIKDFVYRDFKSKFAGSTLGTVWNVIHPLVMIAIYVLIFSQVMRAKLPGSRPSQYSYSVYLCAAILPWGLFNELLIRYTNLFFEHANLIKKVSFPRPILHISAMVTGTINFLISFTIFVIFLGFLILTNRFTIRIPFPSILIFFAVLGLQQIFCLGLGLAFSVLNVFFRDVGQLVNILSLLWFWFTPIVYVIAVVPEKLQRLLKMNPLYYFMSIYRSILYRGDNPELKDIVIVVIFSLLSFIAGAFIYKRLADEVPDEI